MSGSPKYAVTPSVVTSICAIVVTFQPDFARLRALIESMYRQVDTLIVVDNGSFQQAQLISLTKSAGVHLLPLLGNVGLAAAQNIGITWAKKNAATAVLLLDQDSQPAPDMVARLADMAEILAQSGEKVAAVGPQFIETHRQEGLPFLQIGLLGVKRIRQQEGFAAPPFVEVDFLIASGSLIQLAVLDEIGGMREGLFIDNVDIEWCYRARSHGYRSFGVFEAKMLHTIGDNVISMFWGARMQPIHSPIRLYYMMRNRLILYKLPHIPYSWVMQDIPRLISKFLLFTLFVPPRLHNAKLMAKGLCHGIGGIQGAYSSKQGGG